MLVAIAVVILAAAVFHRNQYCELFVINSDNHILIELVLVALLVSQNNADNFFFAFSLLFVVAVCVGLWTMAEVTTLIAEGNSWLKSTYYSIKNMI